MSRRYRIASATALEVACPPLSDRPRCPSASGRRDLYTRACPQGSRPPQESGMTTAPNWAIAPAGPSPARTDSGTGCTWSLTSWVAALSAAPSRHGLWDLSTGRAFKRGPNASPHSLRTDAGSRRSTLYSTVSSRSRSVSSPASCGAGPSAQPSPLRSENTAPRARSGSN